VSSQFYTVRCRNTKVICGSSSFVEFSCVESKHDFKEQIKQLEKRIQDLEAR